MPQEQLQQLKSLLASDAFKGLSGNHGGLIRQESESFGAEVVRHDNDRTQRLHWLNADGENPFPNPVTKVVDWLKRFDPKDGKAERLESHRFQAQFPAKTIRSAHESFRPYFRLIGHSNRRALSRLALSGQLLRGARRWLPEAAPPRPSLMRYVPALCHAIRMKSGP